MNLREVVSKLIEKGFSVDEFRDGDLVEIKVNFKINNSTYVAKLKKDWMFGGVNIFHSSIFLVNNKSSHVDYNKYIFPANLIDFYKTIVNMVEYNKTISSVLKETRIARVKFEINTIGLDINHMCYSKMCLETELKHLCGEITKEEYNCRILTLKEEYKNSNSEIEKTID